MEFAHGILSLFGGEVSRGLQRTHFSCWTVFVDGFAQLTTRKPARHRGVSARTTTKLYHMGLRGTVSEAHWRCQRIARLAHLCRVRPCPDPCSSAFAKVPFCGSRRDGLCLDATTIDLCLSLFPWAKFRTAKAAVKLHTLLDLRGAIPSFIHISDGKLHDVNVLDVLIAEPGAFDVMDRGYLDFERLYRLHQAAPFRNRQSKSST